MQSTLGCALSCATVSLSFSTSLYLFPRCKLLGLWRETLLLKKWQPFMCVQKITKRTGRWQTVIKTLHTHTHTHFRSKTHVVRQERQRYNQTRTAINFNIYSFNSSTFSRQLRRCNASKYCFNYKLDSEDTCVKTKHEYRRQNCKCSTPWNDWKGSRKEQKGRNNHCWTIGTVSLTVHHKDT